MWALKDKFICTVIFTTYRICTTAQQSQTLSLKLEASGTGSKI